MMNVLLAKAEKIKCLVCDVDGVLTDGKVHVDHLGNESKSFYIPDGMGLRLLMLAGIEIAVITGSCSLSIEHRVKYLGINHYFPGQCDKRPAFETLKEHLKLNDEAFAYVGDDLPDLPLIKQVGLGVAVANAMSEVKEFADWQTVEYGGQGAVRAVCDLILKAQGKQNIALSRYYKHD